MNSEFPYKLDYVFNSWLALSLFSTSPLGVLLTSANMRRLFNYLPWINYYKKGIKLRVCSRRRRKDLKRWRKVLKQKEKIKTEFLDLNNISSTSPVINPGGYLVPATCLRLYIVSSRVYVLDQEKKKGFRNLSKLPKRVICGNCPWRRLHSKPSTISRNLIYLQLKAAKMKKVRTEEEKFRSACEASCSFGFVTDAAVLQKA